MLKYDLEKILPHKNPMILIDDVVDVDIENGTITACYIPNDKKIFFDKEHNGVKSIVAIELMAQTIGCYAYFKNKEKEPKMGFLLGTRLLEISIDYFEAGKIYEITAKAVFSDDCISSFDCIIKNECDEIASATINVYQNDNIKEQWSQ